LFLGKAMHEVCLDDFFQVDRASAWRFHTLMVGSVRAETQWTCGTTLNRGGRNRTYCS
jgi:hypothetical protein